MSYIKSLETAVSQARHNNADAYKSIAISLGFMHYTGNFQSNYGVILDDLEKDDVRITSSFVKRFDVKRFITVKNGKFCLTVNHKSYLSQAFMDEIANETDCDKILKALSDNLKIFKEKKEKADIITRISKLVSDEYSSQAPEKVASVFFHVAQQLNITSEIVAYFAALATEPAEPAEPTEPAEPAQAPVKHHKHK